MAGQVGLFRQIVVAALLVVAAGGAWVERDAISTALGLEPGETREGARRDGREAPVIVAPVTMASDTLTLEAVGTGRALRSVMLRAEASGKVAEMPLEAGRWHEAGDVLLRLDDTEQRLALELAQTRLSEAERVLARFRRLETSGAAAQSRLDEVRTAAEVARIEVERAREALEDRVVRSPFPGVPGLADIEEGAWLDSDVTVASFDDRSVLLVEFDLPEALLARVRPGQAVTATSPSAPGALLEGSVSTIDSRISAASRTVKVQVRIPNPDDLLRPGASFAVRLDLSGGTYARVPELAVQFSRGSLNVWRVTDGKAERVEVALVRRQDGAVLVDGPLAEGDMVVIEGTQRLNPGKAVNVIGTRAGGSS